MNMSKEDGVLEISLRPTKQSNQVPIETLEWVIREKLREAQQYVERKPWETWSIYQVPRRLRDVQEDMNAYKPQTVSIGPYYHGSEQVQDMECRKWVVLQQMLQRTGQDIDIYIDSIREIEKQARACYQQELVHLSSDKFVEMMVLDGCFIIELLIYCFEENEIDDNPVFSDQRIIDDILLDMIILGNQIPLFVIGKLHKTMRTCKPDENHRNQVMAFTLNLFNPEWLTGKSILGREFDELKSSIKEEFEDCQHILDVFRRSLIHVGTPENTTTTTQDNTTKVESAEGRTYTGCLKRWLHYNQDFFKEVTQRSNSESAKIPENTIYKQGIQRSNSESAKTPENTIYKQGNQRKVCNNLVSGCLKKLLRYNHGPDRQLIYRVSQLREGGIKFRKRDSNCLWDIKFRNGVLEIPSIWIQDSTKTIFLNVAAFEHCHLKKISHAVIASYVVFMGCLIKSPEDVAYLHHMGIIQHLLGHDSEVVDMFKNISKEMLVEAHSGYYAELSEKVNTYYNKRRHRWRATLLHKYLNNPWAIISLVVAFLLLLLTAIQSFYAVYGYYKPNSK